MRLLKLAMDVLDHKGGQPGRCGHRGGGRRGEGGHNGYEKKDEEMVYKTTKEK